MVELLEAVAAATIAASADIAWAAVADVGNVHKRLVPGFVTHTQLTDDVRTVTFANGVVIRERIVTIDPETRRIAYSSVGGQASHHNASIQIVPIGETSCQLVCATDVLPDSLVTNILNNVVSALPIVKATIEGQAR